MGLRKTHCSQGHEYEGKTTPAGAQRCYICVSINGKKRRKEKRVKKNLAKSPTPRGIPCDEKLINRINKKMYIGEVPDNFPELDPCWEVSLKPTPQGYKRIGVWHAHFNNTRFLLIHRVMWKYHNQKTRPCKSDEVISHLCENRGCCNPNHLHRVKRGENLSFQWKRKRKAGKIIAQENQGEFS